MFREAYRRRRCLLRLLRVESDQGESEAALRHRDEGWEAIRHRRTIERLATTEQTSIVIERQPDGKMRVTSGFWDGEKVFLREQVLEVRNVEGRIHVARKPRRHDEWDPPIPPYDPYGPGDEFIDD